MNKRQHKKWLKKYFEEVVTPIEDLKLDIQDRTKRQAERRV